MTRYKATAEGTVPFTEQEETEWDAMLEEQAAQALIDAPKLAREAAKTARAALVEAITVTTTAGNVFDGDEVSQTRMSRAIISIGSSGLTMPWVLSDNTVATVTVEELREALLMAGSAQSSLWVLK